MWIDDKLVRFFTSLQTGEKPLQPSCYSQLALETIVQLKVEYDPDVIAFLKENRLQARGIGYIDCHLLASAISASNTFIWTFDKRFYRVASQLGVAYNPDLMLLNVPNSG